MSSNMQRSENHIDICEFKNCNRITNYRLLKVGNCHLKTQNANFVPIIDRRTQSTKDSLIKQFLINMKTRVGERETGEKNRERE